ncbi:MAG: ketosteroid isomerase-like protein [Candidatus Azotimanducaceae bacterium]
MKIEDLQKYSDAWNSHDIDEIMTYMSEDCVFETGGGSEHYGTRFKGSDTVRKRFVQVWTDLPDVHFLAMSHFVQGNHGCSEWTFTGTRLDGEKIEIDGCDLFTFESGKISSKRSYLKNRS